MYRDKLIVVIPIYKENPSNEEKKAIKNNIEKLKEYEICFAGPIGLNIQEYKELSDREISIVSFDEKYFKGIRGYNKLMLSPKFYEAFIDFEFLCICQPDVWIIKKGRCLDEFLDDAYDYIGAPWCSGRQLSVVPEMKNKLAITVATVINSMFRSYYIYVGNGGFSIRNIRNHIKLLREHSILRIIWWQNEDCFYSYAGMKHMSNFNVASSAIAETFALEKNAKEMIEDNNRIPVGVHAYGKYYSQVADLKIV